MAKASTPLLERAGERRQSDQHAKVDVEEQSAVISRDEHAAYPVETRVPLTTSIFDKLRGIAGRNLIGAGRRLLPLQPESGSVPSGPVERGAADPAAQSDPEQPAAAFVFPDVKDMDAASNLEWNRQRWGQAAGWQERDEYGYRWSAGDFQHTSGSVAEMMDRWFRPYVEPRHDLDILEISPGAGRITVELIRYARSMCLVDLNEAAIDICRQRLRYYPTPVQYVVNDGRSLADVSGPLDVVASYDSLVHVRPEIIREYLEQAVSLLRNGGLLWIDHSGRGLKQSNHRTETTAEMVAGWADDLRVAVVDQIFRNDWDCITIMTKGGAS